MSVRKSEALASSLVAGIHFAQAKLVDIWDSLGIMEEMRAERMETVKNHIEGLLNAMIGEEEALKNRIQANITDFQKKLSTLCLEMSMDPYNLEEGLTILQVEKQLRLRVEDLTTEKEARLKELRLLQQQELQLCEELCVTPYYIPTGSLPSRAQLQKIRVHVDTIAEEKKSRLKTFSGLREAIRTLMEEMGHEPETSLERESVCSDEGVFQLTLGNIKALKLLHGQMEVKKESLLKSLEELKEQARSLWNRLGSEQENRRFQESVQGTLSDCITQWQREVERLSELQKAKLEEVIVKVREELLALWDQCMFGPEQRQPFNDSFRDSNFTEELLALHDTELLKTKAYQAQASPLLDAFQKWQRNWVLLQEFEKKANDPNRFSNRGGALLKESKDRVRVQKMLPKLEEELKTRVEAWEEDRGSDFLVWGQKVMTYITNQWEEHRQQKGKEKSERSQNSSTSKTPTKRAHGGMNGPTPSKIRKQIPNQISTTFICVSSKPPLSSQKKTKPLESNMHTPLQEFNRNVEPVDISYSDFTSELSRNAVLNSTVKDHS